MTGHLCLKWNNHSSAFLKSISNIHIKERYCDATIACQGKYFPVHRVVLSTCSDYFDEMFERMQCQHPYIVFKDIEPREMELLLNYMYQGEVNVVQEMLPTLIKAAEALKVKGLAVPDDMPSNKDSSCGKKRTNTSNDNPQPKRRSEESRRRRRDSSELHTNSQTTENSDGSSLQNNEGRLIKEEPVDSGDYADGALDAAFGDGGLPGENPSASHDPDSKNEDVFGNFAAIPDEGAVFIKSEPAALVPHEDPYEEQSSSWSDFGSGSVLPNLPTSEVGGPDDMSGMEQGPRESGSNTPFQFYPPPSKGSSAPATSDKSDTTPSSGVETPSDNSYAKSDRTPSSGVETLGDNSYPPNSHVYKCPFCDYQSLGGGRNVKRHIRFKHTGEKPFPCSVCSRRFVEKVALDRHMRIHTGERPFSCPVCFISFSHKVSLKLHLRKNHESYPN